MSYRSATILSIVATYLVMTLHDSARYWLDLPSVVFVAIPAACMIAYLWSRSSRMALMYGAHVSLAMGVIGALLGSLMVLGSMRKEPVSQIEARDVGAVTVTLFTWICIATFLYVLAAGRGAKTTEAHEARGTAPEKTSARA